MNNEFGQARVQVSLFMVMATTKKLDEAGLLQKAQDATNDEDKLAAVKEGAVLIKNECDKAFKPTEKAQEIKKVIQEDLVRHLYKFFGFDYEEHEEAAV